MNQPAAASLSKITPRARLRYLLDRLATTGVTFGGLGVIFAVVLIFFYLLWVVLPLFFPASLTPLAQYEVPGSQAPSLYFAMEEQGERAVRVTTDGDISFFDLQNGKLGKTTSLQRSLVAVTEVDAHHNDLAALTEAGEVIRFGHRYRLSYPKAGGRIITPRVEFPYGEEGIQAAQGRSLAVRDSDDKMVVAVGDQKTVHFIGFEKSTSFLDDSVELEEVARTTIPLPGAVDQIIIDPLMDWLYAIDYPRAQVYIFNIRRLESPVLNETVSLAPAGVHTITAGMLAGGISLMTSASDGKVTQWFPLRNDKGEYRLQKVREFSTPNNEPANVLVFEQSRRSFATLTSGGYLGLFHATAETEVLQKQLPIPDLIRGAISPRADRLLVESNERQLALLEVHNPHPEISWKALWGKIWYESYQEPAYVWQSSAANSDFEPKFSLSPLSFGTLKAAFYAMLFAVPLALAGAVFTAYFMAPGLRQIVKPTIEVMEALPTVILGFLAGLWLAPFIESYLPGIFMMILFVIVAMPLTGWLWFNAPERLRSRVADGWQPVILILPLLLAAAAALALSRPMEMVFFDGNLPHWLTNQMGISYDQRNSLVVGLAMGFAVIPTIFSIAEDAVFGVPKHLSQGSLALGATPWQTLVRVVLPTASPGIFSALMIGMGRAVGETMIVLMATGNTPIMDFNIFEGFRTLSANIAVEMPESEVGSTHFRILFLAGLVLFMFTFVFNTLAEVIRQRLRSKYSSL